MALSTTCNAYWNVKVLCAQSSILTLLSRLSPNLVLDEYGIEILILMKWLSGLFMATLSQICHKDVLLWTSCCLQLFQGQLPVKIWHFAAISCCLISLASISPHKHILLWKFTEWQNVTKPSNTNTVWFAQLTKKLMHPNPVLSSKWQVNLMLVTV